MPELRIGCSGWKYAYWRERFYPKGVPASHWLEYHAGYFDTVENTFYRLPLRTSVERWVEQSPPRFMFVVKMSRYVTHIKRLTGLDDSLQLF